MNNCTCGNKLYLLNSIGLVGTEYYYKTYRCNCGNISEEEIYPLYFKYPDNRYAPTINLPRGHFLYNRGTLTNTIAMSRFVWQEYYKQILPHYIEVHHINGIKHDNRVYNLHASFNGHDTRIQQLPHSKILLELRNKISELENKLAEQGINKNELSTM